MTIRKKPSLASSTPEVSFDVQSEDDTLVKEINMLEPTLKMNDSNQLFGPITVDFKPQAMVAAKLCGKEGQLKDEIEQQELSEANIVCACFEAIDIFGNSNKELKCLQREPLISVIEYPSDQAVVNGKNLTDGVNVKAHMHSGLHMAEFSWYIRFRPEDKLESGALPSGKGSVKGTTCIIDQALDDTRLFNGKYFLVVEGKDIGGREVKHLQNSWIAVNFRITGKPKDLN